ncbi:MAG: PAS domain S-box protein [Prosthecobacter sp.]|nr:PAS domain S-box protein [Prosthecobacter sp.]
MAGDLSNRSSGRQNTVFEKARLQGAVASEERYRALFEHAPDGILIADSENCYLDANASICRMLGYARDELIGMHASAILAQTEIANIGPALDATKSGSGRQREVQFRRKDNSVFAAEQIVTALPDGNLMVMIRDITERRRVEQALRIKQEHSQSLLRLARRLEGVLTVEDILEVSRDEVERTLGIHAVWFYVFSEDRRFLRIIGANHRTEEVPQAKDGELLLIEGDQMLEEIAAAEAIVVVEDARTDPRTNKRLVERLGNRTIVNMPVTLSGRKLGTIGAGTFGDEGVRVLNAEECEFFAALASHVAAVLDRVQALEKRQLAEAALRQSDARFVKAFESNPAAMCITTVKDGRFIEVNDRYCQMFNSTREELIGKSALKLSLWADPATRALLVELLQARGFVRDYETRFRRRNGEPLDAMISMELIDFPGENEPVLIAMFTDFTERKQAEAKINRLNADLEQRVIRRTAELEAANKELEAFSYSVSHDLRAPLRAVDGFSRAVMEDYGPHLPEAGQRYLQTIREGAQRMGLLIDDLLNFSRLSRVSLGKRTLDMGGLVQAALDELSGQRQGRQIDLRIGDLPPCKGDPALLKQVWINLLSNAIKYTQRREAAVIEVGCTAEQGINTYFVRDNGTGFDMRYFGKLFGVFQRLHRAEDYPGTGVGLAIVQRVIHRHGGRVWAEAAPDLGATFYFTLESATSS